MSNWNSVENQTPPKNKSSIMLVMGGQMFIGKRRYGNLGEPSQDVFAYRCDSSGRFVDVITHWMPLPELPKPKI